MPVIDCPVQNKLVARFDQFAPFFLKAMTVVKGKCITQEELCLRTGWSCNKVKHITSRITWEHVPLGDMNTLLDACRVRLDRPQDLRKHLKWLLKQKFRHMQLSHNALLGRFLRKMDSLSEQHPTRQTWMKMLAKVNQERLEAAKF